MANVSRVVALWRSLTPLYLMQIDRTTFSLPVQHDPCHGHGQAKFTFSARFACFIYVACGIFNHIRKTPAASRTVPAITGLSHTQMS